MTQEIMTRLISYFSIFSNNNSAEPEQKISLRLIAVKQKLPIQIVRGDIATIVQVSELVQKREQDKQQKRLQNQLLHKPNAKEPLDEYIFHDGKNSLLSDFIFYDMKLPDSENTTDDKSRIDGNNISDINSRNDDNGIADKNGKNKNFLETDRDIMNITQNIEGLLDGDYDDVAFSSGLLEKGILLTSPGEFNILENQLSTEDFRFSGNQFSKNLSFGNMVHSKNKISAGFSFVNLQTNDAIFPIKGEYLADLKAAIQEAHPLSFTYISNKNKESRFSAVPIKIAFDNIENKYYFITVEPQEHKEKASKKSTVKNPHYTSYLIDHIISCNHTDKKSSKEIYYPTDKDRAYLDEVAPTVWGMAFNEAPKKVVVRFYDEANVLAKVRWDLSFRKPESLQEEVIIEDGKSINTLIYKDTVRGLSSFRRWIYGFGSSVVVMEPQNLRDQIIHSYQIRLEMYKSKR